MLCRVSSESKIVDMQNQDVGGTETLCLDTWFNATLCVARSMIPR